MINKIRIENFKKFTTAEFGINQPLSLFVGQNNGGKTTALQAISLWSFLIGQWKLKKGGGSAKERAGASITRAEIHPAPVLEIADLWNAGQVREKGKTSENRRIKILLSGVDDESGDPWEYGVEATFANKELLYAKPVDIDLPLPREVGKVFHLPPLSGVQTEEAKIDPGAQLRAIGEGRPGEILRNLLLDLHDSDEKKWSKLVSAARSFFAIELLPISYNPGTDPRISVYYQSSAGSDTQKYRMEISSAGSGFLQFLLIASFLLVHNGAILLIDEPDSHMHVFLQRSIFEWLQGVALEEGAQLIISTHSEVLINSTGVENLVTFFGSTPRTMKAQGNQLITALSQVSPLAIVHAEWKERIIYVEGESDRKILVAWADAAGHPIKQRLSNAFFSYLGTNGINKAKGHFQAIESVIGGKIQGIILRDNVKKKSTGLPGGLSCEYWKLPEIENYLLHPQTLIGFAENFGLGGLFGVAKRKKAKDYLRDHLAPAYFNDPHNNTVDLGGTKGSDFLEDFFKAVGISISKSEYWKVALKMKKEQVFPEVNKMLDKLSDFLE